MGGLFSSPSIPAPPPPPAPDPAIAANQQKQEERLVSQEKAQQDRLRATKRARQTGGMLWALCLRHWDQAAPTQWGANHAESL
jgi:hypothetical protein